MVGHETSTTDAGRPAAHEHHSQGVLFLNGHLK